jgi:hypothetical protein
MIAEWPLTTQGRVQEIRPYGSTRADRFPGEQRDPRSLLEIGGDCMTSATTVPVTISPEARSFIEGLDQGEDLEKMIDRAARTVPRLRSIEVVLDEATAEMPARIVLWVHRDDVDPASDPTHRDWIGWMAATLPPGGQSQRLATLALSRSWSVQASSLWLALLLQATLRSV